MRSSVNITKAARRRAIDMAGKTFGRLTVIKRYRHGFSVNGKQTHATWLCACECGKRLVVSGTSLRSGNTVSCGCFRVESSSKRRTTHGMSKSTEYTVWLNIKSRCRNIKNTAWPDYGGRGIDICDRWFESFSNFIGDIGFRPTQGHSIDRINNDLGYTCGVCEKCKELGRSCNVRWATRRQQARNHRGNRMLTAFGRTMCLTDWADEAGINHLIISSRIDHGGWSAEDAISIKPRAAGKAKSITEIGVGQTKFITAEYRALHSAIDRCNRVKNTSYHRYGGRGITVCDGWRTHETGFESFLADLGPRPTPKHSLDRMDVDGNYSCGHCPQCMRNGWPLNVRWATPEEQANNKRQHNI